MVKHLRSERQVTLKRVLCAMASAIACMHASPASATLTSYDSESAFLAAAGNVTVESFESSSGSGLTTLQTPNFLLSHSGGTFSVLTSPSPYGTFATDGTHFLEEATALVNNQFQFAGFAAPISAFGLYITDYGDYGSHPLVLTVNSTDQFVIATPTGPSANGSLLYFGVVASGTSLITNVTLGSDDAIGIDKVSVSTVPETSSLILSCTGLLLMALFARSRSLP